MQLGVRALPSMFPYCVVSMSLRRKRNQLTWFQTSKSVRSLGAWFYIALPSPVSAVSAFASHLRTCLPRTGVVGGRVAAGVGMDGVAAGGCMGVLAVGGGWII